MEKEITYKKPLFRSRIGVSYKPIVIAKSLEEGLDDLAKTAQEEEQEACWLYVHDDSEWYNLASKPAEEIFGRIAGFEERDLPIVGNKRYIDYHTHPKRCLEQEMKEVLEEKRELHPELNAQELEQLKKAIYVYCSLPSSTDIGNYIRYVHEERRDNLHFGVVSPGFIAEIELDAALIRPGYEFRYEGLQLSLNKEFSREVWAKASALELAQEYCKKLNAGIPGLSIKIRQHSGVGK